MGGPSECRPCGQRAETRHSEQAESQAPGPGTHGPAKPSTLMADISRSCGSLGHRWVMPSTKKARHVLCAPEPSQHAPDGGPYRLKYRMWHSHQLRVKIKQQQPQNHGPPSDPNLRTAATVKGTCRLGLEDQVESCVLPPCRGPRKGEAPSGPRQGLEHPLGLHGPGHSYYSIKAGILGSQARKQWPAPC